MYSSTQYSTRVYGHTQYRYGHTGMDIANNIAIMLEQIAILQYILHVPG